MPLAYDSHDLLFDQGQLRQSVRGGRVSAGQVQYPGSSTISIDEERTENGDTLHEVLGADGRQEDATLDAEERALLAAFVAGLTGRERVIMNGLLDGLQHAEIARGLGTSGQRVSQIAGDLFDRAREQCASAGRNRSAPAPASSSRRKRPDVQWNGRTLSVTELAAELGFPRRLLGLRLDRGWSEEEAARTPTGARRQSEHSQGARVQGEVPAPGPRPTRESHSPPTRAA